MDSSANAMRQCKIEEEEKEEEASAVVAEIEI
jgi:hypothetical protein